MNSAELPAPQIGRILVAAGLLTEAQLAEALEEQEQTSRRLGEIIVNRGFISGPALANALAEQHGGVLKTEYGYATGLGGEVAKRAAADADPGIPRLRTVETPPPDEPAQPQVAEQHAQPEPAPPTPEPEPPAPAPEPVVEPAPEPPPEAPAEPPLPPAAEQPAEAVEPAPEPSGPDERDELIATLRAQLDVQGAELIALREALERARAPQEPEPEPMVVVDEAPPAPAPPPAPTPNQREQFLLCVPTDAGYVLVDRYGVVPEVGEVVEVPEEEGKFTVTKVVRLPRNGRACAYLQRDRPAD